MTDAYQQPRAAAVPDKPALDGLEAVWSARWEADQVYRFDRSQPREAVYSIDMPPPTVSGSLHVGHVFSYTHPDIMARYQRMTGKAVFFPIGWDDNGLPTERRVQNVYGVRCDPTAAYDPDFTPPAEGGGSAGKKTEVPVSRRNFIELCERLTEIDERAFEDLWRRVGLSVDWSLLYTTISADSRRVSQRAFLHNLGRGEAYRAEAPTLWDVTFQTAVAQAELEDRDYPGAFHRISFHGPSGPVWIETTRPELLPACVALVAHPDDARYQGLFGGTAATPVFGVEVPVYPHPLAEPDKGSGIAMVCTFGDLTDVTWWRELDLPTRAIIGRNGRLLADPPAGVPVAPYAELAGKTVFSARARMVELLRESGDLDGEPRPVTRPVKFYERGDKPLEIVTSGQWYIRNGGRDARIRAELIDRGRELSWHPPHMRVRYENWVAGLAGDWLISRQRFFGVPFPVWYPLDAAGSPLYSSPIVPSPADALPVDPASDPAPGYDESQRGVPGGFIADPDVMDTWATSSLTPQIAGRWGTDPDLFARVFPMDLRPQSHEIIRTWLFSTVTRSHLEFGSLPWANAAISGWILDPDRKKMSKSKGNVVVPTELLAQYGSDAVRYWAANGRYGVDTAFDPGQLKVGRRLAIKILNASKFVLSLDGPVGPATSPVDRSLLTALGGVVREASAALSSYDHTGALEAIERFFWMFCDDYLELVKTRAYGAGAASADDESASARGALRQALDVQLRLFAPFLPFVTEEAWSWWQDGSVHAAAWPSAEVASGADAGDPVVLATAAAVLGQVRKAKTEARLSIRAEAARVVVRGPDEAAVRASETDLRAAGNIADFSFEHAPELGTEITLAEAVAS
ncbi:MAG: valyl-tRNA synthetase [Trebonia sp.]|jgi:valyl-tRNA synthetase|nr:valyl-tRNA synthetase [Trebonia sp.]